MSFQRRITLVSAAAVAIAVVLASALTYLLVSHQLRGQIDSQLRTRSAGLRLIASNAPGTLSARDEAYLKRVLSHPGRPRPPATADRDGSQLGALLAPPPNAGDSGTPADRAPGRMALRCRVTHSSTSLPIPARCAATSS